MVMAQSLFITLKELSTENQIDVLAPAWTSSLLDRMPQVHANIAMPIGRGSLGFAARYRLGKTLASLNYDQAILLPNSWKSALIPFFAGIPIRTGFRGESRWGLLNDIRQLDKSLLTMTVQRFVALAYSSTHALPPECPAPELVIKDIDLTEAIKKFHITTGKKILVLCPGAEFGKAKRWPAQNFASVALHKLTEGWQVWLFGSEKDKQVTREINQKTHDQCLDFSGKTSMTEVIDLMSLADAVVTNDSGLMHVAAALKKKLVALYGSTDPSFTPPLNVESKIISLQLECAPCFARECRYGHYRCLTEIKPERVLAAID